MLAALAELYGDYGDQARASFVVSNKDIATELGYDEGQFSRILNPSLGKAPTDQVYARLAQRVQHLADSRRKDVEIGEVRDELARARRGQRNMGLAATAAGVVAVLVSGYSFATSAEGVGPTTVEIQQRRRATLEMYCQEVRQEMANEALMYRDAELLGMHVGEEERHARELAIKFANITPRMRLILSRMEVPTEAGIPLAEVLEQVADNQIEQNVREALPLARDPRVSARNLHDLVIARVQVVQDEATERIERYIDSVRVADGMR